MLTKQGKVDKRTKIGRVLFSRLEDIKDEVQFEKPKAMKSTQ